MCFNRYSIWSLIFFCSVLHVFSQQHSFKIRKDHPIHFYRIGPVSGEIMAGKSDLFVLLVHDSMKNSVVLDIENGRLEKTDKDSVFKLQYIPGMKYEGVFIRKDEDTGSKKTEFSSLVNGISAFHKDSVRITVSDRNKEKKLMQEKWRFRKE